jgi:hypothetical protein
MSSETWQYIEELLALSPWVAFLVLVACYRVAELRDNVRAVRPLEREDARQAAKRVDRSPRTTH